jgi:hypothetical protein
MKCLYHYKTFKYLIFNNVENVREFNNSINTKCTFYTGDMISVIKYRQLATYSFDYDFLIL